MYTYTYKKYEEIQEGILEITLSFLPASYQKEERKILFVSLMFKQIRYNRLEILLINNHKKKRINHLQY